MTDTTDIAALRKRLQSAISQHEMMMDCVMGLGKVDPMYQQCIDALDQLEAERQRADDIRASFDELAGIVGFSKERCDQTGASPMDCARELRQRADDLVLHVNTQANMREKAEKERDAYSAISEDVGAIVTLLQNNEWAEHVTETNAGSVLEHEVTRLMNQNAELRAKLANPVVLPTIQRIDGDDWYWADAVVKNIHANGFNAVKE
jgi:uncharacterized UPF0160 family protein